MAFRRGDEHAHIAVAQDMFDLRALEQRIDWHEAPAGACGGECGNDIFHTLVEPDGDTFATLQSKRQQAAGAGVDGCIERRIAEGMLAVAER